MNHCCCLQFIFLTQFVNSDNDNNDKFVDPEVCIRVCNVNGRYRIKIPEIIHVRGFQSLIVNPYIHSKTILFIAENGTESMI